MVGISRYADPQYDLDYARSDAEFFVSVLMEEFGFDRAMTLFDADATKARILGLFENELQTVDEDDGVVVFFCRARHHDARRLGRRQGLPDPPRRNDCEPVAQPLRLLPSGRTPTDDPSQARVPRRGRVLRRARIA